MNNIKSFCSAGNVELGYDYAYVQVFDIMRPFSLFDNNVKM